MHSGGKSPPFCSSLNSSAYDHSRAVRQGRRSCCSHSANIGKRGMIVESCTFRRIDHAEVTPELIQIGVKTDFAGGNILHEAWPKHPKSPAFANPTELEILAARQWTFRSFDAMVDLQ